MNEAATNDTPPPHTDDADTTIIEPETQQQETDKKALSTSSATFVPKTQSQQDAADKKALSVSSTPFVPSSASTTTPKTTSQQEADKKALSVSSVAFVPKIRSQPVVDAKAPAASVSSSAAASFEHPSWNHNPYIHQAHAENWEQGQFYDQEQKQMWEHEQWEQQQRWEQEQIWSQDMMMGTPEHAMVYMPSGGYHHPVNMMQGNGMMISPMVMSGHEMTMMGVPGSMYPSTHTHAQV